MATADKLALLKATKADLKAALTEKGQAPGDVLSDYPDLVRAIETGTQLPELTSPGGAADLRQGKQLIDQSGAVVDGTLANVEQATPTISVDSDGWITASATQKAGLVTEGTKTVNLQLSSSMDADFVAANIKKGVNIFGVNGALPEYKVADLGANSEYTSNYDELVSISGNSMTLKIENPDNLVENWASDNLSDVLRHLVVSVHSIDRAGGSASQSTAQCNLLIENFFSSDYSLRVVCARWSRDGTVSEGYYEDDSSANYTCNAEDGSITITSSLISKLYTKYVDVEGVLYTKRPRW